MRRNDGVLIEADTRRALLLGVLASLPEKQRNGILLHEVEGMPMREVADALEVPLKTAHSRLRTGRIELDRRVRRLRAGAAMMLPALTVVAPAGAGLPPDAPGASSERQRRALGRVRALAACRLFADALGVTRAAAQTGAARSDPCRLCGAGRLAAVAR